MFAQAFAITLKGLLGWVCGPIAGWVVVPWVNRIGSSWAPVAMDRAEVTRAPSGVMAGAMYSGVMPVSFPRGVPSDATLRTGRCLRRRISGDFRQGCKGADEEC
ncbi:hypothetical protein [Pasteuria penetrans]|uniref:hypothetical protein n=1 Tax=Pasteuria penetrans TaxID=86005 RepID=UPI000FBD5C9D|nr:hypothetical protein [Pasteuria penetrans]